MRIETQLRPKGLTIRPVYGDINEAYAVLSTDKTTLTFYYDSQKASRSGTKYALNSGTNHPEWRTSERTSIKKVVFNSSFATYYPTSCYEWFETFNSLTTITGLQYLKTDLVANMAYMFSGCKLLKTLDLSTFKTNNVKNMTYMFYGCNALTSLNISNFQTASVTNFQYMFANCSSLEEINIESFAFTSNTSSNYMMQWCTNLKRIYASYALTLTKSKMSDYTFYGVGTVNVPCRIYGTDYDVLNWPAGYFVLKGGYFKTDYVDLELPSGKLWATCNVGAINPTQNGAFRAWGESTRMATGNIDVENKTNFTDNNYTFFFPAESNTHNFNGTYHYISSSDIGGKWATVKHYKINGKASTKTFLYSESDHLDEACNMDANYNMIPIQYKGGTYYSRMPSKADFEELKANCDYDIVELGGAKFALFQSKTNMTKWIILPLAGRKNSSGFWGGQAAYWSSTKAYYMIDMGIEYPTAWYLSYEENGAPIIDYAAPGATGQSIRPIAYPSSLMSNEAIFDFSETDGIDNMLPSVDTDADDGAIYTLQGVKVVGKPQPGIYVRNGRKFVVK